LLKNSVPLPSGAEALAEKKSFIAALKALRHPKAGSSANCKAVPLQSSPKTDPLTFSAE
jgi:hypothetical protein